MAKYTLNKKGLLNMENNIYKPGSTEYKKLDAFAKMLLAFDCFKYAAVEYTQNQFDEKFIYTTVIVEGPFGNRYELLNVRQYKTVINARTPHDIAAVVNEIIVGQY